MESTGQTLMTVRGIENESSGIRLIGFWHDPCDVGIMKFFISKTINFFLLKSEGSNHTGCSKD